VISIDNNKRWLYELHRHNKLCKILITAAPHAANIAAPTPKERDMLKRLIVDGDTTDHGGRVSAPNNLAKVGEHNVALVGNGVHCPQCNAEATIVEGNPVQRLDGIAIAEEGHFTSCGARLVSVMQITAAFDHDIGRVVVTDVEEDGPGPRDGFFERG